MERVYARLTWGQWLDKMVKRYGAGPGYIIADLTRIQITFYRGRSGSFAQGGIFIPPDDTSTPGELLEVIMDAGYERHPSATDFPGIFRKKYQHAECETKQYLLRTRRGGYECMFNVTTTLPPEPQIDRLYLQNAPIGTRLEHDVFCNATGYRMHFHYDYYESVAPLEPLRLYGTGDPSTIGPISLKRARWEKRMVVVPGRYRPESIPVWERVS